MTLPNQPSIELPLLLEMERAGGSVRPKDVYNAVAKHFLELTEEDRKLRTPKTGANLFINRVQFARKDLAKKGQLDGSMHGLWKITQAGKDRVAREWPDWKPSSPIEEDSKSLVDPLPTEHAPTRPSLDGRNQLLKRVCSLDDRQFERLCGRLLEAMGFEAVEITGRSHDRGIDGHGTLKYLNLKVPFQAKNWQSNQVGSRQVREFRGSVVNRFQIGVYITTSSFSHGAQEEADEPGPPQVVLIDGERLIEIMVEKGLGTRTVPVGHQAGNR